MTAIELPALYVDSVALESASQRLLVVNRDPGPDESGVPVDATLVLELVDTGPSGINRTVTQIWVDGQVAFDGSAIPEFAPPYSGSLAEAASTSDTLRVVLHPVAPLASLATIAVRVVTATADAVATLDTTYVFTAEDKTAPRLVAAQALGQHQLRVAFDESVAPSTGASWLVVPRGAPAVPLTVVDVATDGNVVTLSMNMEMTPDVAHEVRALDVRDLAGNPTAPPFDRGAFFGFRPARPPTRQFELWRMLPKHNRRDDQTGDLFRFIACLQEATDLLLADVDRWPEIFDFERAPERFVDLILRELGNPFPFELELLGKRRLASVLVEMYRQKGTEKGLRNAVRFFLGIDVAAVTAFNSDALVLGESELGIDWVLAPSDRFALYAFNVEVERLLTDIERRQLRAIVEYLKPAHTHFVDLLEPVPIVLPEHWELGLSELGDTSDLH